MTKSGKDVRCGVLGPENLEAQAPVGLQPSFRHADSTGDHLGKVPRAFASFAISKDRPRRQLAPV